MKITILKVKLDNNSKKMRKNLQMENTRSKEDHFYLLLEFSEDF